MGFCHTIIQISHNYTNMPSLSSLLPLPTSHPSRSSQSTRSCYSHQLSILHLVVCVHMLVKSLSRVRLCEPMDCSLPRSSVHGIFQARVLEWAAISFSVCMYRCIISSYTYKYILFKIYFTMYIYLYILYITDVCCI